ncbi:hypothetical protein KOW79_013408 [Hemibagrus wyckioides]|uniref:Hemimethylated DNA-binding domain-containing protein n=1 Tax=Hemibagrus wyckioides TaxID=337641 RepID=A0A9D3SGQ1_9TELE|nr:uncharacterized protein si:dkey-261l7.2 [Hemibagrus wyckioides]KAG7323706.1 hypothetical protein KOW79_013408 [Hemibagrus wyckioides]
MPQVTGPILLQLALLLCALPAQYLIMEWTSGTAAQRILATQGILETWKSMRMSYLNMTVWVDWITSWMPKFPLLGVEDDLEEMHGEMMALEILMHGNNFGYFAASEVPRSPRPGYVLHRVGEVVMETQNHMVGVIVGWDEGLRAPPEWLKRKKYTESEVKRMENTPHYKILFSGPDPSSLMIGYLPQNVLQLFEGYMPEIPTLEQYFSHFNGKKFVMLDWLKALYPED